MLFKTISEVSDELKIRPSVLRYWETQFKHINPIRKCGKRLYTQDTIELLKEIKTLLYTKGFTIKGAREILDNNQLSLRDVASAVRDDLVILRNFLSRF